MSSSLHRLTPRPPLGWNSYDSFGCFINAHRALANLRVFVDRLKPHGYEYFVLDAGWFRQYELGGREFPGKDDSYVVRHDSFGRPVPAPCFFPDDLAPVADACHAAGVKFGIHMMRGVPRAAVAANTPISGTSLHARDIANTADTCSWCPDNFGVDMTRPGAQSYYDSVVGLLSGWGVDFIKYDDIVPSPPEVDAVVNALGRCGREIVLSLSPGNGHNTDGWQSYFQANMIRTSGDIWDDREDFRWVFERWQQFMPLAERLPPGCWFDQDMIPFGELQVWNPAQGEQVGHILMNGKGSRRMSGLNEAQKRTFMTMRALAASPLFMGGNLPATDDYSFHLLTHPGMLACNQNGVTGRLVTYTDWTSTWQTPHRTEAGAGWFGIFNRDGANPRAGNATLEILGIPAAAPLVDVWTGRPLAAIDLRRELPPDEVLFVRYGLA